MASSTMQPADEPHYDVVWPLGKQLDDSVPLPSRLPDLNGKVIGELWDWLYHGDRLFPLVREELQKRYPGVRFVEYSTFGNIHGPDERQIVAGLPDTLHEFGVDAVITGVGH